MLREEQILEASLRLNSKQHRVKPTGLIWSETVLVTVFLSNFTMSESAVGGITNRNTDFLYCSTVLAISGYCTVTVAYFTSTSK